MHFDINMKKVSVKKIVSGGQTGVDRAALDTAIELKIPHGGWCPKGRIAEDGTLIEKYLLRETETGDYINRTKFNVRDSDGTLIILRGVAEGGTALTIEEALQLEKPLFIFNLLDNDPPDAISEWIQNNQIKILNIAGPRESKQPGIYNSAKKLLMGILDDMEQQIS